MDATNDVFVDWSTVPVLIKRKAYMYNGTPFTVDPCDPHQIVPMPRWFVEEHGLVIFSDLGNDYDI